MSAFTNGLKLHLKLDQIEAGNKVKNEVDGTMLPMTGTPKLIDDEKFGKCIHFPPIDGNIQRDGNIQLLATPKLSFSTGVTVAFWVKPIAREMQRSLLSNGGVELISLTNSGSLWAMANHQLVPDQWQLLVWRNQPNGSQQEAQFFINAAPTLAQASNDSRIYTANASTPLYLGGGGDAITAAKLAQVRIWNRPLSNANIEQLYIEDRHFAQPYRSVFPIDFTLHNQNDEPSIFVTDHPIGPDHRLTLNIMNNSGGHSHTGRKLWLHGIDYKKPSGKPVADKDHYHFELRFRPGVLSAETMKGLIVAGSSGSAKWAVSAPKQGENKQWYSAYLLRTDLSKTAKSEFKAGDHYTIELDHISAGGLGGSRGTLIEFRANERTVSYDPGGAVGLRETRIHHMNIVNHRGKKHIPLHVGFVGTNQVLNNGQPQTLKLRITNTSDKPIPLKDAAAKPRFVLRFQSSEAQTERWALATDAQVGEIKVKIVNSRKPKRKPKEATDPTAGLGISKEIEITNATGLPVVLGPMSNVGAKCSVDIELSNIVTTFSAGTTNLYVSYHNIPGYWDGQFVCPIEKSPLHFYSPSLGVTTVGIGASDPKAQLVVMKKAVLGGNITPLGSEPLTVMGRGAGVSFQDRSIGANAGSDDQRFVIYNQKKKLHFWNNVDKVVIDGATGNLTVTGDITAKNLTATGNIQANGNVDIGKANQSAKLDVKGSVAIDGIVKMKNKGATATFIPNWGVAQSGLAAKTQVVGLLNASPNAPQLRFKGVGTDYVDIGQNKDGSFVVEVNDSPKLVIQKNGNLEIGAGGKITGASGGRFALKAHGDFYTNGKGFKDGYIFSVRGNRRDYRFDNAEILQVMPSNFDQQTEWEKLRDENHHPAKPPSKYSFTLEQASSRDYKQDLSTISSHEALETLALLSPVKYRYKDETSHRPNLGFIAEEMPDNLASPDRKSLAPFEIIPILTRVAQEQQEMIEALQAEIERLRDEGQQ